MKPQHERLLARARRAFGDVSPEVAIGKTRAITGPGKIPDSEKAAQEAMKKLLDGKEPTSDELVALEFVIRVMRPALLTKKGLLPPLDAQGQNLHPPLLIDRWEKFRQNAETRLGSVGRIDHASGRHIGTGFLVRPDALATNRHVLDVLTGGSSILRRGDAIVRFHAEANEQEPPDTKAKLLRVIDVHPRLDIALLEVELSAARAPLPIDFDATPEDGHPIVVVGFPAKSDESNPLFGEAIFGRFSGVRRGALGELVEPDDPRIYHDCTTLAGNSGSPVFSLLTHKVIGIHRSGAFAYRNEGVVAREIRTVLA